MNTVHSGGGSFSSANTPQHPALDDISPRSEKVAGGRRSSLRHTAPSHHAPRREEYRDFVGVMAR